MFERNFELELYTHELGNPTMARQTIERKNEMFLAKLQAETVQDPFFQTQKKGFDTVKSLFVNCAGVGCQVLRPVASCTVDQNIQPYKLSVSELVPKYTLAEEQSRSFVGSVQRVESEALGLQDSWFSLLKDQKSLNPETIIRTDDCFFEV